MAFMIGSVNRGLFHHNSRKGVFRNHVGPETEHNVIRQAKPAVGTYAWQPQVHNLRHRQEPHARGTWFADLGRSGLGTVGPRTGKALTTVQTSAAGELAGLGGGVTATSAGNLSVAAIMTRVRPGV